MSDHDIPNESIEISKENSRKDDKCSLMKITDNKPLIIYPFGFYSNMNMYLIPHPDYPDNLDMY